MEKINANALINRTRQSLAFEYAKHANKRWQSFEKLDDCKARQIAQKLWASMQRGKYIIYNMEFLGIR